MFDGLNSSDLENYCPMRCDAVYSGKYLQFTEIYNPPSLQDKRINLLE